MPIYKKKFVEQEVLFSALWFRNYSLVILGSLLVSIGYSFFIVPHALVPGGIFGLSIVINHVTSYPIGVIALCMNIPLLLWGIFVLGGKFGVKTILAMVLCSVFIDGFNYFFEGLSLTKDILVSAMFGGGIIGLGIALVIKAGATTGGTDIIAQIFSKYFRLPIGQMFLFIDGLIVFVSVLVFGDIDLAPYCIIAIFSISKTVDAVLVGLNIQKAVFIISDKHAVIRQFILDMDRGGTYFNGEGLFFSGENKKIIFTVLSRKELSELEAFIKGVDTDAFFTTMNTNDVFGHGFKALD